MAVSDGRWGVVGLLTAAALAASTGPARAQMTCDPCVIGVALDGPWERNDEVRLGFEQEVADLVGPRFRVTFPSEKRRVADWTIAGARDVVDDLLADPVVDLVLTAGPVVSSQVADREELRKPVVAAFVHSPEVQGFPIAMTGSGERVSGVPNLSYITFSGDPLEELRHFRQVAPFTRLTYVAHDEPWTAGPLEAGLRRGAASLGVEMAAVRVGVSVDAAIGAIPPDAEAIYLTPLRQLPPGGFDRLVRALRERRLPTFSWWGSSEVDRGLLTSIYSATDLRRLGRRIALHVQRILGGEDASVLPIDFRRDQRLTLNMATARAVGLSPSWRVLTEAEVLHDRRQGARYLSLASAAREAVSANLDLAAFDHVVAAGRQTVRTARSVLRPQITASAVTETPAGNPVLRAMGLQPSWFAAGSVAVTQLLYSEGARAELQTELHLQRSREHSREEIRLDVAHGAATGYLDVLRAKTLERLQWDNLTITRSHLDLARSRQRIGVARASEVARWESQVAIDRRDLLKVRAQRRVTEIALNRLLDRPLEELFGTVDVDPNDPALLAVPSMLDAYAGNEAAFEHFRAFMAAEGLARSAELRQIDAAIDAQERQVLAARRALWVPTVAARGDVGGVGHGDIGLNGLPFALGQPSAFNWTVGLSATLPLFEGGARRADRSRAERALDELRFTRRAVAARVEQRIRSALHLANASYVAIDFTVEAALAARTNLELVTDSYREGSAPLLDLIDAQQTALATRRMETNAVYDYLVDLMDVHRAIGQFGFFMEPAEIAGFTERLREFYRSTAIQQDEPAKTMAGGSR